jgi:hypothetical protein
MSLFNTEATLSSLENRTQDSFVDYMAVLLREVLDDHNLVPFPLTELRA